MTSDDVGPPSPHMSHARNLERLWSGAEWRARRGLLAARTRAVERSGAGPKDAAVIGPESEEKDA